MVGLIKYVIMLDDSQIKMYVSQTWVTTLANKIASFKCQAPRIKPFKKPDSSQKANAKVKI